MSETDPGAGRPPAAELSEADMQQRMAEMSQHPDIQTLGAPGVEQQVNMEQRNDTQGAPTPYDRDFREAENLYPDSPDQIPQVVAAAEAERYGGLIEREPAAVLALNEAQEVAWGPGGKELSADKVVVHPHHEIAESIPDPGELAQGIVEKEQHSEALYAKHPGSREAVQAKVRADLAEAKQSGNEQRIKKAQAEADYYDPAKREQAREAVMTELYGDRWNEYKEAAGVQNVGELIAAKHEQNPQPQEQETVPSEAYLPENIVTKDGSPVESLVKNAVSAENWRDMVDLKDGSVRLLYKTPRFRQLYAQAMTAKLHNDPVTRREMLTAGFSGEVSPDGKLVTSAGEVTEDDAIDIIQGKLSPDQVSESLAEGYKQFKTEVTNLKPETAEVEGQEPVPAEAYQPENVTTLDGSSVENLVKDAVKAENWRDMVKLQGRSVRLLYRIPRFRQLHGRAIVERIQADPVMNRQMTEQGFSGEVSPNGNFMTTDGEETALSVMDAMRGRLNVDQMDDAIDDGYKRFRSEVMSRKPVAAEVEDQGSVAAEMAEVAAVEAPLDLEIDVAEVSEDLSRPQRVKNAIKRAGRFLKKAAKLTGKAFKQPQAFAAEGMAHMQDMVEADNKQETLKRRVGRAAAVGAMATGMMVYIKTVQLAESAQRQWEEANKK